MGSPVRYNGINGNTPPKDPARRSLFDDVVQRVDAAARRQLSSEFSSDDEMDIIAQRTKRGLEFNGSSSSPKRPRSVQASSSSFPESLLSQPPFRFQLPPTPVQPAEEESSWALVPPGGFDDSLARPDAQLMKARGQKDFRIRAPEAPQRIDPSQKAKAERTPFIRNAKETQALIRAKVKENPCIPFELEVAPGKRVKILRVSTLINNVGDDASSNGQHAEVYRCEVEGDGLWVLKLFKDEILKEKPHEVLNYAASQLLRYAQSKQNPFLRGHVAEHANLEPHLHAEEVQDALAESDLDDCHTLLRKYVEKEIQQGFHFVRLVPREFPVEFDVESPSWKQLKAIYAECKRSHICHDLQRDNVRVNEWGVVQIIDLFERDPDETEIACSTKLETFTDRQDAKDWIIQP